MAAYKVIQDIEAEDKLLGPLTLRQFIYALITAACGYFSFLLISKGWHFGAAVYSTGVVYGIFAFPWSKEQPTEVWALAKLRFYFKTRKRIWNQSGVKELVTITAPKQIERVLTNGLSQHEVRSHLQALANTIDSRGWAVKNVDLNLYTQPLGGVSDPTSDRLVSAGSLPQEVPSYDISAADDMLDAQNNPIAQQFDSMIATQTKQHRAHVMQQMQQAASGAAAPSNQTAATQPADYWFLHQAPAVPLAPGQAQFTAAPAVAPGVVVDDSQVVASPEEEAVAARAKQLNAELRQKTYGHMKNLTPVSEQAAAAASVTAVNPAAPPATTTVATTPVPTPQPAPPKSVTPQPDPAILELASRDDLNVATIARQAKKVTQSDDGEVVISLH